MVEVYVNNYLVDGNWLDNLPNEKNHTWS